MADTNAENEMQKNFLFQYNGRNGRENYLQWRDRQGNYHNFPVTMGRNCNRNWPTMTNDTIIMNDPSLLPITGVRYGPIK